MGAFVAYNLFILLNCFIKTLCSSKKVMIIIINVTVVIVIIIMFTISSIVS